MESDAELRWRIDSFAHAADSDLAVGEEALQQQLREVLASSGKVVQLMVESALAPGQVRMCSKLFSCFLLWCVAFYRQGADSMMQDASSHLGGWFQRQRAACGVPLRASVACLALLWRSCLIQHVLFLRMLGCLV